MHIGIRRAGLLALATVGAVFLTACGSSTTPKAAGASPSTAALTGPRVGQTITISYTNDESAAFSLPEFRIGGQAAVDYLNRHGGINGAKIALDTCIADASPEGSINCANKAVAAKADIAYTGIDVASDAAMPILSAAGIPYVTSNPWGTAQDNNPDSFILETGSSAYAIAPLQTLKNLGDTKVAVLLENTPAGKDFVKNVVTPIGEGTLGLSITPIFVDSAHPDWTTAVTTAMASHPDGIFGQLTEADCIGMVTATSTLGFKGPVMAGSCTGYIQALGAKAVGTYISSDIFTPATKQYAPPQIQTNLDIYTAAMAADGQSKDDEGFASAAFSSIMELASVLKTIPTATPITPAAVVAALSGDTDSPGFLGSDLHCAAHPLPTEKSSCRSDILVFKIVKDASGAIVKQLIGTGFQDVSPLVS